MRKIFCFIDSQEHIKGELQALLEELDIRGDEIYLYTGLDNSVNDPDNIITEIGRVLPGRNDNHHLVFISNIENLVSIIYRLYHQMFQEFIYFQQPDTAEYQLEGIYASISRSPVVKEEELYKPLYSNAGQYTVSGYSCTVRPLSQFLVKSTGINMESAQVLKRKYYHIGQNYILFEPVLTPEKVVISLPEVKGQNRFIFPGFSSMRYIADCDYNLLNQLVELLGNIKPAVITELYDLFEYLEEQMKDYSYVTYRMTCCILDDAAQLDNSKDIVRSVYIYSFLMQLTKLPHYINNLLNTVIENEYLDSANRFFIWNQCKRYLFTTRVGFNGDTEQLMKRLYLTALEGYKKQLDSLLTPIPKEERDEDTVLIMTIQFLAEGHAPTRTTLERCYTIGKLLGKRIIVINTKEQYTREGAILVYRPTYANEIEELSKVRSYQHKDYVMPFYQPEGNMPRLEEMIKIVNTVREIKPYFILGIGSGSIVADLCSNILPVASMGLVFSNFSTTAAQFSIIGRSIADNEWVKLINNGYTRDNVIESTFTFELKQKKGTFTREEFGLPRDRFLLVTVGIRLDADVKDDFVEMLQSTFDFGTHVVFAGKFDTYEDYCSRYPRLKEHSTFIGYCDDILALMEICDLYVNPIRAGGGFSIVEAFHEGKPGVTVRYGDIATAAGDDFCVSNYKEMENVILRYIREPKFYQAMSDKARAREKVVTDSVAAMQQIIDKIQNNRLFF